MTSLAHRRAGVVAQRVAHPSGREIRRATHDHMRALQPVLAAVRAVVDRDVVDVRQAAEVDLPPRRRRVGVRAGAVAPGSLCTAAASEASGSCKESCLHVRSSSCRWRGPARRPSRQSMSSPRRSAGRRSCRRSPRRTCCWCRRRRIRRRRRGRMRSRRSAGPGAGSSGRSRLHRRRRLQWRAGHPCRSCPRLRTEQSEQA